MSDNNQLLTVDKLLIELKEVTKWQLLGAYLRVPVHIIEEIALKHNGIVETCKIYMLQYWLNNTMGASWKDIAEVLEHLNFLNTAARLKRKYMRTPTSSKESISQPLSSDTDPTSTDDDPLDADVKVMRQLQNLEADFSNMIIDTKRDLANSDISEVNLYLDSLIGGEEFHESCETIDEVLRKLRRDHIDTFNIRYLGHLVNKFCKSAIIQSVERYEEKKENFLKDTKVIAFQQAVVTRAERVVPKGKAAVSIKIPTEYGVPKTMKDVEELARKAFKACYKDLVEINVIVGSIIITWYVQEVFCKELVQMAQENITVLREEGVEEVNINVGKKSITLYTHQERQQEDRMQLEGQENIMHGLCSFCPMCQIEVTGDGQNFAITGQETSFELNICSHDNLSYPFPVDQLFCQLTDPEQKCVPCSFSTNSTQLGVCTVTYTPTLRGPHKLSIAIKGTNIQGSPFTVNVLPSPEIRGVVQLTTTGFNKPWGVAISKSGEVVVTEHRGHCISVYSREMKKIGSFGSKDDFLYPRSVSITSDSKILIADDNKVQKYTLKGEFLTSVTLKEKEFSGIAVHPSNKVFIADTKNHQIRVLNPDLSDSHKFGSKGSAPGQFSYPRSVACDNCGKVYVTDLCNHRVQVFSADGQFISSFGSKGSQHGQLFYPAGICIDSTNTVYVTDVNHRVSVYTSSGQFIKCFSTKGSGEGELFHPEGVAIDNTTGALYVCDYWNNRVVVY